MLLLDKSSLDAVAYKAVHMHTPKRRLHISSLHTGIGMILEREALDEPTFPAVFLNLHFQVTHSPRSYVRGSRLTSHHQTLRGCLRTHPGVSGHKPSAGAVPVGSGEPKSRWASWPGPSSPPAIQALSPWHREEFGILPISACEVREFLI